MKPTKLSHINIIIPIHGDAHDGIRFQNMENVIILKGYHRKDIIIMNQNQITTGKIGTR